MELRERRLAQIVRAFLDACVQAGEVEEHLRSDSLEFARVEQLVGEAEDAVLYRLKEDCHALFRSDQGRPANELAAEELFDLAVGALFHEAMKFREGFYVTRRYGPRLERMRAGDGSSPLLDTFHAVLESGRRRVGESAAELRSLLRETREQLLILLRQGGASGAVARALVEDPARSEQVFGSDLRELLIEIFGDEELAYSRALDDLLDNGHFEEALRLLDRAELRDRPSLRSSHPYASGMASYYRGRFEESVASFERWSCDHPERSRHAARVLASLARDVAAHEPGLAGRALRASQRLS